MSHKVIMFAAVLGLAACEPRAGVRLVEMSGRLQVLFFNCTQTDQLLPVKEVMVRRISADQHAAPECLLRARSYPSIAGAWRYGEPIDGYEMQGCAPLQPGQTYQVHARMGPSTADTVVALELNGEFVTRSGGCD